MKIATLILSFLAFILIPIVVAVTQVAQAQAPEFSVSFKMVNETERQPENEKKYSVNGNGTSTIIVSNAMVSLLVDNDGDEEYPKMTCKLDLDASETTDCYVIFYLNFSTYGGGWFTFGDLETDVYTLEKGYSPSEGLFYLDLYFISGYGSMKVDIKAEVYYTNGSLAATYGPDDDPDLKNIPAESVDTDTKEDPFATPATTPSPTPTPTPAVDEIKLDSSKLENGNRLTLHKGESIKVSAEALSGGEAISDTEIEAEADNGVVTVSPSVAATDENGLAEFTITAKKKGNAKISFTSGDAKKVLRVKVK